MYNSRTKISSDQIPEHFRANRPKWLQFIGRNIIYLLGWKVTGGVPKDTLGKNIVAIFAPHTSNWDGILGFAAMRYRGAYNATKFAIEGLTDTMRMELKGSGVEMILIEPGPIRTKIRENAYKNFKKWITVEGSAHEGLYRKILIPRLSAVNPKKDPFELGVEAVTKAVVHAVEAKRPRLRYRITWATKMMMVVKRLLPTRLMDKVARNF